MQETESIDEYILQHIDPESDYLKALYRDTHVKLLRPRMASGHLQGRMLKMFVKMIRPRQILEIGTYSGYSALCLAEGLSEGGMLHTFEINDEQEDFTRPWLEKSPFADKIRFYIGDSHVRGHLYPLITRRRLEHDFGAEAVYPDVISYRTGGLAHETGEPGIVYHMIGINGATSVTFSDDEKIKEIASLHPDLIIVSFGTNEAHSRRYLAQAHKMQIGRLLGMLKAACPEAAFLLTTPPGAYVGRRRARTINPRTVTAARIIKEYAQENKMAVWDMYNIVGGKTDACRNWTKHHMLRADGIHFTPDGYRLQGNLLHQALIKAYNEYVATGLE